MKSDITFEEMKLRLREEFLDLIGENEGVETIISVWDKNERIALSEEKITDLYFAAPYYYNIEVVIKYEKNKSSNTFEKYYKVSIGKNSFFPDKSSFASNLPKILGLSQNDYSELENWAICAAKKVEEKVYEENCYYLRYICFDMIPDKENSGKFVILNLPLENIKFSSTRRSSIIGVTAFIKKNIKEYTDFLNSDYMRWMEEHKKNNN